MRYLGFGLGLFSMASVFVLSLWQVYELALPSDQLSIVSTEPKDTSSNNATFVKQIREALEDGVSKQPVGNQQPLIKNVHFDETVPLHPTNLNIYSGEQIFKAAYHAYVCSFLMTLAGQMEKGQLLRFYSVKLMYEDSVKEYGKHWNDVNFSGGLFAFQLASKFSKELNISEQVAAERILTHPKCKLLNQYTESLLIKLK